MRRRVGFGSTVPVAIAAATVVTTFLAGIESLAAADRPIGVSPGFSRSYSAGPLRQDLGFEASSLSSAALGLSIPNSRSEAVAPRFVPNELDDPLSASLLSVRLRDSGRYPFNRPRLGLGYGYPVYEYPFGSTLSSPRHYGYGYITPRYYGSDFHRPSHSLAYRPYYSFYYRPFYLPTYRSLTYYSPYSRYSIDRLPYLSSGWVRPPYAVLPFDDLEYDPFYRPYFAHCYDVCGYDYGGYCCPAVP